MADQTSQITVTAKDDTAAGVNSAINNQKRLTAELQKQAKISSDEARNLQLQATKNNRSFDDLLRNRIRFNKESDDFAKRKQKRDADEAAAEKAKAEAAAKAAEAAKRNNRQAEDGHNKTMSAAKAASSELVNMATRYLTVGTAINEARKAFLGFAESERQLSVLQNQTKMTSAELGKFETRVRDISLATQTGFDETVASVNNFRTGMNISLDEATRRMPRLITIAKGLGVAPETMSKSVADLMRNLKIPAEQTAQALEIIGASSREAGVNVNDLSTNTAELAEVASSLGYKGTQGLSSLLVMLGEAGEVMGDTSKGAALLRNALNQFESDTMGTLMRGNAERWRTELQQVRESGGDVAGYIVNQFKQVRDKESIYHQLSVKERILLHKLVEDDNGQISKKIKLLEDAKNGQLALNDGVRTMAGADGDVNKLSASVKLLADEFGRFLVTIEVPEALTIMSEKFKDLGDSIKYMGEWIKWVKGEGPIPEWHIIGPHGMTMPSFGSVLRGMGGEHEVKRSKERLGAELKKEGDVPGAMPLPGVPNFVPPPYTPLRFSGGGGGGGAWDSSGFTRGSRSGVWGQMRRSDNIEDRRGEGGVTGPVLTGQGGATALRGLVGKGSEESEQKYGSSMDARYLTAAYHPGGGDGGGGGGGGSYGGGQYQGAGPGAYGGGSGYGGQTSIPRTGNDTSTTPTTTTPDAGPAAASPGGTATGDYQGKRVNADVMKTRIQQANAEWMKDPKNQQTIYRTLQAEGGMKNMGANLEQMSNYAASRGKTLQQVVEARGRNQFYGPLRRFHGDPGSGPLRPHERDAYYSPWTDAKQKAWDKASGDVFSGGSNRINYATDQGTVGDPNYNPAKMTAYGGNMFGVQPGTEGWVGSQRGKADVAGPVTVPATTASTAPTASSSSSSMLPGTVPGGGRSPGAPNQWQYQGVMDMEGKSYNFGSGGSGKGATPAGSYNINIDSRLGVPGAGGRGTLGDVGKRIGSVATVGGLSGEIGDGRAGIQIHKAMTKRLDKLYTAGCFGIEPSQWPAYREHLLDMARRNPQGLRVDVGKDGRAQVVVRGTPLPMPGDNKPTQTATPSVNNVTGAQNAEANKASGTPTAPAGEQTGSGASAPSSPSAEGGGGGGDGRSASIDKDVNVKLRVNDNDVQFARTSMRRQADKEVREARWNSYSDIGAA